MSMWTPLEFPWMRPPWWPAGTVANPNNQPRCVPLEVGSVEIDGERRRVIEKVVSEEPFSQLTAFLPERLVEAPPVLIVMPMSGHYSLILRDLIIALLPDFDVFVLDWTSAQLAPTDAGAFGFDGNIAAIIDAVRIIGPQTHLIGVCQGATPAAAAAALLHQSEAVERPASIALLGGPVDPSAAPTRLTKLLQATSREFIEKVALQPAPEQTPGAGRLVYPATSQQRGLLTHLTRQWANGGPLVRTVMANEGLNPSRFPFLTSYTTVKDIEGGAFAENIVKVFHENQFPRGALEWRGEKIQPDAVKDLGLMTVEATEDDIAAPGQTAAAHKIFSAIPGQLRRRLTIRGGNHFSLFHGPSAREIVAPALVAFFNRTQPNA